MTAPTLSVVTGGLGDDQAHLDGVTQTDQTVAQLGLTVEGLDLVLHVTQFADGPRESVAGADESHIVPHDVLDGLHVALKQGRI